MGIDKYWQGFLNGEMEMIKVRFGMGIRKE